MKGLNLLLGLALAGASIQPAAFAQTKVQKEERKEVRTDRKEVREDRKDAVKAPPGKASAKERKEVRKGRQETREDRRDLKKERRADRK